jgi:hypothetical protein
VYAILLAFYILNEKTHEVVFVKKGGYQQGRSQLKTNLGAFSIKYQGIYTIIKEIQEKIEVDISNFWFYRGAHAPGKANVASPLDIKADK